MAEYLVQTVPNPRDGNFIEPGAGERLRGPESELMELTRVQEMCVS